MPIRDKIHISKFLSHALVGISIVTMSIGVYVLLNVFYSSVLSTDTVTELNVILRTIGLLFISITLFAASNEQLTKQNIKQYTPIVALFTLILHIELLL